MNKEFISKPHHTKFSWRANWSITWGVFVQRTTQISRYKAALFFDIITPLLFSVFPIFIGISVAGGYGNAVKNFQSSVGSTTANFVIYSILGANVFQIINGALFNFGFFLRREQVTGTLESLYLAPISQIYVLLGTGFYAIVRALINFFVSLILAGLIFRVNPFTSFSGVMFALLFLLVGMLPLYGLAFGFGALVVKYKDMQSLQGIISNFMGVAMGIFFPITLLPIYFQVFSYLLPPTWQNNGIRSSLIGTQWILGSWYGDLMVILALSLFYPLVGAKVYSMTDRSMRKTQGLGVF